MVVTYSLYMVFGTYIGSLYGALQIFSSTLMVSLYILNFVWVRACVRVCVCVSQHNQFDRALVW